jgi:hypothetical protein
LSNDATANRRGGSVHAGTSIDSIAELPADFGAAGLGAAAGRGTAAGRGAAAGRVGAGAASAPANPAISAAAQAVACSDRRDLID